MKQQFVTNSIRQTEQVAKDFGNTLKGGEVVLLCGEMGAGKTHFTKGLALGLAINDVITSPTFALHNQYFGRLTLNHFDFYRVDDPVEAEMLGLDDFFYDKNAVSAIEWSENIAYLLPKDCIMVTITKLSNESRQITIER
ncbi:MAG: tRNA (adenosine(37)-N6)-threonylcarbamoyltransferase complex ATPase subunit type 1 TsaE [Clostridia bacterium]|nr:tRNA (adenosine(37)-N6)-threonylcarbamoyltransferase complex ATPase subunit type 1 TsaE [Clostridia bacterium]